MEPPGTAPGSDPLITGAFIAIAPEEARQKYPLCPRISSDTGDGNADAPGRAQGAALRAQGSGRRGQGLMYVKPWACRCDNSATPEGTMSSSQTS